MICNDFNPNRLALAREKRAMTKVALASASGVALRSLTAYEAGETVPTSETISALAQALKFPQQFFFSPDPERPLVESVSFRSLTKMTAGQKGAAVASSALAFELLDWIEQRFTLPRCSLVDLRDFSPEAAAAEVRNQWGLGQRPVSNAVHLLEANGIRVFSLVEKCREVDAYSFWRGDTPFIFLNTMKSSERSRFDAMHELGHLVLHRHAAPAGRTAEIEADAFAAAMLMPRADVLASAPRFPTLLGLIELKKRWIVALSALAYRLHSLDILSDWHYRNICIQISEHGYRKNEPESAPRETSQLLKKVFEALKQEGVSRADVAQDLAISLDDLDSLIFGLLPFSRIAGGQSSEKPRQRSHLSLVKDKSE